MAVDMFLKLDGIKGESKDHKHKDEIHIESFSWGLNQTGAHGTGGGGGAGKVSVHDISITKFLDKSSCALMLHCCNGKHIKDGLITVRKAGDKPLEYLKGYRVYRMDGPKINGPGQKVVRLTAGPIDVAKWTDETGATDTKRYWVVTVDRLGQEGIPSAPAWGWRQYRKVYETFTGEWHQ